MIRIAIILALLCVATQARGQELETTILYPLGSNCQPSKVSDQGVVSEPLCTPLTYAPLGYTFRKNFHEELPWHNNLKTDRAISARPVTAEAAPK